MDRYYIFLHRQSSSRSTQPGQSTQCQIVLDHQFSSNQTFQSTVFGNDSSHKPLKQLNQTTIEAPKKHIPPYMKSSIFDSTPSLQQSSRFSKKNTSSVFDAKETKPTQKPKQNIDLNQSLIVTHQKAPEEEKVRQRLHKTTKLLAEKIGYQEKSKSNQPKTQTLELHRNEPVQQKVERCQSANDMSLIVESQPNHHNQSMHLNLDHVRQKSLHDSISHTTRERLEDVEDFVGYQRRRQFSSSLFEGSKYADTPTNAKQTKADQEKDSKYAKLKLKNRNLSEIFGQEKVVRESQPLKERLLPSNISMHDFDSLKFHKDLAPGQDLYVIEEEKDKLTYQQKLHRSYKSSLDSHNFESTSYTDRNQKISIKSQKYKPDLMSKPLKSSVVAQPVKQAKAKSMNKMQSQISLI